MRQRGVALERRRLDTVERQGRQQHRRAAERFEVGGKDDPAIGFDVGGQAPDRGVLDLTGIGRAEAD